MHKYLWIFYFALSPFLLTSSTFDSFAFKQSIFLLFLGVQSLFFAYCINTKSIYFKLKHLDYLIIFVFILRCSTSFYYLDTLKLYPSLGTLTFEFFLLLFYLQLRILKIDLKTIDSIIKALCFSCFTIFLLQALSIVKPLIFTNRFDANFFHPNILGIIFCSFLIYFHSSCEKQIKYYFIAIILLLVSFSKVAYFIYFTYLLVKYRFHLKIILFIFFAYCFFTFNNQDSLNKFRNNLQRSLQIKSHIYKASLNAIYQKPLGYGTGLYAYKIQKFLPDSFHLIFPNPNHHTLYKAHNFILELTFESGLFMLIFLLYSIIYLLSFQKSPIKNTLFVLVIASMTSMHLNYPESQILFLLLLSYLESQKEEYL
ncbi:MAG: hypothetical protein COB02_12630 [Candidatus Cloacimonadota bacterium]|nr:MAG: hypothetical protein COB02_12630 [Candidatus Cloacimonadota bacterium]